MYLVCGEALFDVFTGPGASGNRLNLEAVAGGSPYNVAVGLARLGVKAALLGGLSNDLFGSACSVCCRRKASIPASW